MTPLPVIVCETPNADNERRLQAAAFDGGLKPGQYVVLYVVPSSAGIHPSAAETSAGRTALFAELLNRRPKIILAVGAGALAAFQVREEGEDEPDEDDTPALSTVRGRPTKWTHPADPHYQPELVATWHPYFAFRNGEDSQTAAEFGADVALLRYATEVETRMLPVDTGRRTRGQAYAGRRVYNAWFFGNDVRLLCGTPDGGREEIAVREPWYFLAPLADFTEANRGDVELIWRDGVTHRGRTTRVVKMERDPEIPDFWVRIYPEVPATWTTEQVKRASPMGVRYATVSPLLGMARAFAAAGVRTFEADVTPLRRFLTDHEVVFAHDHRRGHVDLETDDVNLPGKVADIIGRVPILSIAAEDDFGRKWFRRMSEHSFAAERALLTWFVQEVLPHFDLVTAWNGSEFDWPFLIARCHVHGIDVPWWRWILWDSLYSFKKHHLWDADSKTSFSLENVSRTLLGEGKIDRGNKRVFHLWRDDPERLELYNCGDVDRMRRIEAATGYVEADLRMNALAGCPAWNIHISARVDAMALVEGYGRGTHFRTKELPRDDDLADKYHGAYVFDPVPGVYEDVANLDFASLYPSVFVSWNISPDTYVPPEAAPGFAAEALTTCPEFYDETGTRRGGSRFRKGPLGVLPTIYARIAAERARCKAERRKYPVGSAEDQQWKRHEYVAKTLGLSIYGCMGSVYSRYFNRDVAEAVTLTAQYLIRTTMKLAEGEGRRAIYGDTDSLFIAVPQDYVPGFLSRCAAFYSYLTTVNNCAENRIELEYEQYFARLAMFKKKRYAGRLIVQKNKACDVLEVKGLEMRRSDGAVLARQVQTTIVQGIVMHGWDAARVRDLLVRLRDRTFAGGLTLDELRITAAVTKPLDAYKSAPPQVVVARAMEAAGREVFPGTKIAYVVTDGRKGIIAAEADEYARAPLGYDPVFYWNRKIWPALERVVAVVYATEDWSPFATIRYEKEKRRNMPASVGRAVPV